jgi:hypothetical protein
MDRLLGDDHRTPRVHDGESTLSVPGGDPFPDLRLPSFRMGKRYLFVETYLVCDAHRARTEEALQQP